MYRLDTIKRNPTIPRSKNLSVRPADKPSDRLILLMFLPATAVKTSPAVFIGLRLAAKLPIVFTMKFFLNSVVWFIIKPHRMDLISITIRCIISASRINHQSAVLRAFNMFNGPIQSINATTNNKPSKKM